MNSNFLFYSSDLLLLQPPKALKVRNIAVEKGTRILLIKLLESLFIADNLCYMQV